MRIVRCQFGFGLDHKNVSDVEKNRIVQINQTDALQMDMGMKDTNAYFDKIRNSHAVLHCLFEILSPGYNRYLRLYRNKLMFTWRMNLIIFPTQMTSASGHLGDRDIRPATKSDMIRFGSSFSLAYIKIIPFSRGIRIFRSPGVNSFLYK